MIRINLLPEEFRRTERASPKLFAATIAGVILVCSAFGWFGLVYFGELGNLEVEQAAVAEDLVGKKKHAAYCDDLIKEKSEYANRSNTIQSIRRSRVAWTAILDELIDVVNNNGDTERHLAWFRGVTVRPGPGKDAGPLVMMPGLVQGDSLKGDSLQKVANFHEDVEAAHFFNEVRTKSPPSGVLEVDNKRLPPEAMFFDFKLAFKPPQEWERNNVSATSAKK